MGTGVATHVPAHLGPAGLETVDTLIMAGIADDRADAIRLVLPRSREQPEYVLASQGPDGNSRS